MTHDRDPEVDPDLRRKLEQLTATAAVGVTDPMARAQHLVNSQGRPALGVVLAIAAGCAVALLFAMTRLPPDQVGQVATPTPSIADPPSASAPASESPPGQGEPATPEVSSTPEPSESPAAECDPIAPRELPDGSAPGEARPASQEGIPAWDWGTDSNAVRLVANHPSYSGPEYPPAELFDTVVRGQPAATKSVGDTSASEITITWMEASCVYTIWIGPGLTRDEAREYAERY